MIIGNGLVANIFRNSDADNLLFFASGVSNSMEDREDEYKRELDLVKSFKDTELKFIYFSTVSVNNHRRYFHHKREVELFIQKNFKNYIIFRLPNLVGKGGNKTNIFNFFKSKIINNQPIKIYNIYKSFLDVEDMKLICLKCLDYNRIILNICYIEQITVFKFVNLMMEELNKYTKYELCNGYQEDLEDNSLEIKKIIKELNIDSKDYTKKLIKKYK